MFVGGLERVATLRREGREIKGVRLQQKVLLATDAPPLPQPLVSDYHVSVAVDGEDEERVLAASRLAWVRVKPQVVLPRHVSKRSQPGCHGDVFVHVELEVLSRAD